MAVLGLCFYARAFSSCGKRGPLFIAVRGPLTIAASLVAEHRLQTRRLSNCGSRAQLLRGMWDIPRPGLEPVSPALAGRFSTTAPPGKPNFWFLEVLFLGLPLTVPGARGHNRPEWKLGRRGGAALLRQEPFRVQCAFLSPTLLLGVPVASLRERVGLPSVVEHSWRSADMFVFT